MTLSKCPSEGFSNSAAGAPADDVGNAREWKAESGVPGNQRATWEVWRSATRFTPPYDSILARRSKVTAVRREQWCSKVWHQPWLR